MKRVLDAMLVMCVAAGFLVAPLSAELQEKESVRKTLKFSGAGEHTLKVDNVFGAVNVTGYDGSDVELVADVEWNADDTAKMSEAKRLVKLEAQEKGALIDIYVDGPWRNQGGRESRYRGREREGWSVVHTLTLRVPRNTSVTARSVIGDMVSLEGVEGDFNVSNVNGSVKVTDVSGSGDVKTVNGKVMVTLDRNPAKECQFKTVNGAIEVRMQPGLAAEATVKTLNGGVYTDYPASELAVMPEAKRNKDGMFVYKVGREKRLRIGSGGGPKMSFETVNGDIRILSH